MTLLSPNHNYAADECIAQIPQHHIPSQDEKVRASASFDKSVLVAAHMAALHDAYILEMATHPVNEVNIKPASPTSSIGGLKSSTLKQLKIGKVHRRRVLNGTLCSKTLCTKTHNGLMIVNVFEDEEGNATPIYLSNAMEGNGGSAQAQRFYPQGSKVAVKEPYLTRLPDGEVVLLVEKMTDLVFLWVPEYVEENEGSKGHGDGRDVFAMEKGEEDEVPNGDHKDADSGEVVEDAVTGEDVKSSSASRELKFDNLVGAKGEVDNAKIVDEGNIQEAAPTGVIEEEYVKDSSENDKVTLEDGTDQKGGKDAEEVVKTDEVSRELTMEDMLSMGKGEVDNGDLQKMKERDGEDCKDNGAVVGGESVPEDVAELEVQPPKRVNDADAGETDDKASEMKGEEDKGAVVEGESVPEDVAEHEVQPPKPLEDADAGETAASLRIKGNALFARGEFNKAVDIYIRATEKARLDKLKREEVLCLSNKAEVWLRLCRNQAALDDAEAALKLLRELEGDGDNKGDLALAKALFRKGRALMGLHKYEDAMRALQEVLGKAPTDRQLREAAIKCRDHLQRVLKPGKRQRAAMNRKKSASFMMQ